LIEKIRGEAIPNTRSLLRQALHRTVVTIGTDLAGNAIVAPPIDALEEEYVDAFLSHFKWFASQSSLTSKPHQGMTDGMWAVGEHEPDITKFVPLPQDIPEVCLFE